MSESPKAPASEGDGSISKWEILTECQIASTPVFDLVSKKCRHPKNGKEGDFYVIKAGDWVNVLPIDSQGRVVMVRQWRFGVEEFSWEIPGGMMDPGEDPIDAGLRELSEETGYTSNRTKLLGSISPNPAILDNRCYFVLAESVEQSAEKSWDQYEEIEVKLFPIDEVYAMAARGEILHTLVVNALFHYYPEWLKRQVRRRS